MRLSGNFLLFPHVCFFFEIRAYRTYNTKSMFAWCFHNYPLFHSFYNLGSQRQQSINFGLDVVCFYIKMNPARVIDFL